jgi:hypothetical protein
MKKQSPIDNVLALSRLGADVLALIKESGLVRLRRRRVTKAAPKRAATRRKRIVAAIESAT